MIHPETKKPTAEIIAPHVRRVNEQLRMTPVEGGWLLPVGGRPETSSYKGYGLGAVVDVLSGLLTGTGSSLMLNSVQGVGQWFGAWRVDGFVDVADFKAMTTGRPHVELTPEAGGPEARLAGSEALRPGARPPALGPRGTGRRTPSEPL